MKTLEIISCFMFFASASVAATQQDLEDVKLTALNSMNSTELRVQIDSKPILVEYAEKTIEEMNDEFRYFAKSMWNKTLNVLSKVSTVFIEPARLNNVSTSECDGLHRDLRSSVNVALERAHNCITFRVENTKRLIQNIEKLTKVLVNIITYTRSTINSHVGAYTEPTLETIATIHEDMLLANFTVNGYLPRLKEITNELERFVNISREDYCLKITNEYSIHKKLLSTFYRRTGDCVHNAEAKARSARILADGMRTIDELSGNTLNKLFKK